MFKSIGKQFSNLIGGIKSKFVPKPPPKPVKVVKEVEFKAEKFTEPRGSKAAKKRYADGRQKLTRWRIKNGLLIHTEK